VYSFTSGVDFRYGLIFQHSTVVAETTFQFICKTVRPILSDCCLSVCLYVCLSVTLVYCGQTVGKKGTNPRHQIFGPHLLWPNGWMDQDATWYRGRPRPRRRCVRWGPSSLPLKGAQPPVFGPCVLWPDGWMDG